MENEEENEKGKITSEKGLKMLNAEGLDLTIRTGRRSLGIFKKNS
jgi:hypothetical protein